MLDWLTELDQRMLFLVNGAHQPVLDKIFYAVSQKWAGIPLYILLIAFLFKTYRLPKAAVGIVLLVASVGAADLVSTRVFKDNFKRERPSHNTTINEKLHFVDGYRGGQYGFVSSHAANLFALFGAALVVLPQAWLLVLTVLWAIVSAYSRVYLGVHYPFDVLAGAALGFLIGFGLAQLALYKKLLPPLRASN